MKTYFKIKTWRSLWWQALLLFPTLATVLTLSTNSSIWMILIFCPPVNKALLQWSLNRRIRNLIEKDVNNYHYFNSLYETIDSVIFIDERIVPVADLALFVDTLSTIDEYKGPVSEFLQSYDIGVSFLKGYRYTLPETDNLTTVRQWLEKVDPYYVKLDDGHKLGLLRFYVYVALLRREYGLSISSKIETKYSMIANLYLINSK